MKRTLTCLAAVAIVAAGSAVVSAAPVAPHGQWVIQSTPNRAKPQNQLEGISCTSGTACTAVGNSGVLIVYSARDARRPLTARTRPDAGPSTSTLAEHWDGTHWRIQTTPNPAGSSFNLLNAVSCSSRHACTAVGSALAGKVTVPLAERWNGSRWSIESTPRPPHATASELTGVSCPASNECIAVGGYETGSNTSQGFAERWNGSRWTLAGTIRLGIGAFLASVSCSSAQVCTAVGSYETHTNSALPLAERWSGGRWHQQTTPGQGYLDGVSCPSFSECVAVGQPKSKPGQSPVLAMRWSGGKWKTQSMPLLTGSTAGFLLGVSCATVTSCTAAGWLELSSGVTLVVHWDGTRWTADLPPNPAGALVAQFTGIWCGAKIACRASGSYQVSTTVKTLVERN